MAEELRFEEAAALRDRVLELKGEKVQKGIGGLRRKPRGKRGAPAKSMRAAEAPAPPKLSGHDMHSSPRSARSRQKDCATSRSAGSSVNAPRNPVGT